MRYDQELLPNLDAIDQKIVQALSSDGRMTVPALAKAVGVSRATAYSRFDRLIENEVITGFRAVVDPGAVGLDVSALVLLNVAQRAWEDIRKQLRSLPGVEWIGLAAGPFDFVVHVRATDLAHLRDVILNEIQKIDSVRSAQTVVLLDEDGAEA